MSHLEVSHLSFAYEKGLPVLSDLSFCVESGESIGLVGANGVGKSTLLKLLVGLRLDFSGNIFVDDIPVSKNTLPEIRSKIGYVFQDSDSQLFMSTVYDDVAFAPRNYGISAAEVEKRVENALHLVGITHLRDRPIYKLSGGEKKLASIATILSMTPDMILMDEPSVALDPRNRRRLIKVLNSLSQTKMIASHDLDMILDICPRTILMYHGKIVVDGPTEQILSDSVLLQKHGLELPLSLSAQQ